MLVVNIGSNNGLVFGCKIRSILDIYEIKFGTRKWIYTELLIWIYFEGSEDDKLNVSTNGIYPGISEISIDDTVLI